MLEGLTQPRDESEAGPGESQTQAFKSVVNDKPPPLWATWRGIRLRRWLKVVL